MVVEDKPTIFAIPAYGQALKWNWNLKARKGSRGGIALDIDCGHESGSTQADPKRRWLSNPYEWQDAP